jgi:hypothetical protein
MGGRSSGKVEFLVFACDHDIHHCGKPKAH